MRKKLGFLFMFTGAVLLIAALSLFAFNQEQSESAGKSSEQILSEIIKAVEEQTAEPAGQNAAETEPELTVDGNGYIGFLSIPSLNLELPVMSNWDYAKLRLAPCRYFGSVKTNDLVICAHNYASHFGMLKNLRPGDSVLFTDVNGVTTAYTVKDVETLLPTQISEMIDSGYALTLYTCTYGGQSRVTVRCDRAEI